MKCLKSIVSVRFIIVASSQESFMNNVTATSPHTRSSLKKMSRRVFWNRIWDTARPVLLRLALGILIVTLAIAFFQWEPFKTTSLGSGPTKDAGIHEAIYTSASRSFPF